MVWVVRWYAGDVKARKAMGLSCTASFWSASLTLSPLRPEPIQMHAAFFIRALVFVVRKLVFKTLRLYVAVARTLVLWVVWALFLLGFQAIRQE